MPDKRGERIGRAAKCAYLTERTMAHPRNVLNDDEWERTALAAVAKAREIDGTDVILAAAHDMWMKAITVVYHAKRLDGDGTEVTGTSELDAAMREYERHIQNYANNEPKGE